MRDHEDQLKLVQETGEMNSKTRIQQLLGDQEERMKRYKTEIGEKVDEIAKIKEEYERKLQQTSDELRTARDELLDITKKYQESSAQNLTLQTQIKSTNDELEKIKTGFSTQLELLK